jgi:hypothetical protein
MSNFIQLIDNGYQVPENPVSICSASANTAFKALSFPWISDRRAILMQRVYR